jgi:hypothetical protein
MNLDSVLNDVGMLLASGLLLTMGFRKKEWPTARHHGADSVIHPTVVQHLRIIQLAEQAVDAIISGNVRSVEELQGLVPEIMAWLLNSLSLAHDDAEVKNKIKLLLGNTRFTANLEHLGQWHLLQTKCRVEALKLGASMQQYYVDFNLREELGEALPNAFAKVEVERSGSHCRRVVIPCDERTGTRRQDAAAGYCFERDDRNSQLYDEKCYIHFNRMIAMAIDATFQEIVKAECVASQGAYKACAIKNYPRMLNKCVADDDHGRAEFPRPCLNIDVNRNCCTFKTKK